MLNVVSKKDLEKLRQRLLSEERKSVMKSVISHIDKELEQRQQEDKGNE